MKKELLRSWIWWVGLTAVILAAHPVQAQSPNGWTSAAAYTFGQAMTFSLAGVSDADIQSLSLSFQAPEFDNTFVAEVPLPGGTAANGQPVNVSHRVDLSQVRLAPFTTVTYWWSLQLADGRTITLPQQQIHYQDDQFAWRELAQDNVQVHWTGDDLALGQLALDVVAQALPPHGRRRFRAKHST